MAMVESIAWWSACHARKQLPDIAGLVQFPRLSVISAEWPRGPVNRDHKLPPLPPPPPNPVTNPQPAPAAAGQWCDGVRIDQLPVAPVVVIDEEGTATLQCRSHHCYSAEEADDGTGMPVEVAIAANASELGNVMSPGEIIDWLHWLNKEGCFPAAKITLSPEPRREWLIATLIEWQRDVGDDPERPAAAIIQRLIHRPTRRIIIDWGFTIGECE